MAEDIPDTPIARLTALADNYSRLALRKPRGVLQQTTQAMWILRSADIRAVVEMASRPERPVIYVRWSNDGHSIRQWDRKPFPEGSPYEVEAPDLRPCVLAFAILMEQQLRANDHKSGWGSDTPTSLLGRVYDEALELHDAIAGRSLGNVAAGDVGKEAADIANFAMMIADVCGALK